MDQCNHEAYECEPQENENASLLCRVRDACREVRSWSDRSAVRAWTPYDVPTDGLLAELCSATEQEQESGGRSGSFADVLVYVAQRARLVMVHIALLAVFAIGALVIPVRSTAFLVNRLGAVRRVHAALRCHPSDDRSREHLSVVNYMWLEFAVHVAVVLIINTLVVFVVYAPVYHVLYRVLNAILLLLGNVLVSIKYGMIAAALL
uniref:Uncharacterized protein n=1 Tax=Sipha flava TaxID=143950 RepID=A0A2S2QFJ9_9HEMI